MYWLYVTKKKKLSTSVLLVLVLSVYHLLCYKQLWLTIFSCGFQVHFKRENKNDYFGIWVSLFFCFRKETNLRSLTKLFVNFIALIVYQGSCDIGIKKTFLSFYTINDWLNESPNWIGSLTVVCKSHLVHLKGLELLRKWEIYNYLTFKISIKSWDLFNTTKGEITYIN